MKQVLFLTLLLGLISCEQKKEAGFERFVIAATFRNNYDNKADSLEITHSICWNLVYVDRNSNCFIYKRTQGEPEYYQCRLSEMETDDFISRIMKMKRDYPAIYNTAQTCGPDINIVLENDTVTEYHFIQNYHIDESKFVFDFVKSHSGQKTDKPEIIVKYKDYIQSQVSRYVRDSLGIREVKKIPNPNTDSK